MIDTTVRIQRGDDRLAVARALLEDGFAGLIKPGDRVAIKLNQVAGLPPENGHTVPADLVGLAVSLAKDAGAREVVAGDDTGRYSDTWSIYARLGTDEAVRRAGGTLLNLREEPRTRRPVPGGGLVMDEVDISAPLLDCDVLVGLTKPKTHHQAGVTAAIKNMFGAVPDYMKRYSHYTDLDKALVDIIAVRKPDFTLVDGFPAHEGLGPHAGRPVEVGYSLSGRDPVAVDAVSAALMGFSPSFARYVKMAAAKGLGVRDLSRIEVTGATVAELARPFYSALDHMRELVAGTVEVGNTTDCNGCAGAVVTALMLLRRRHDKTHDDFAREFAGLKIQIGEPDGGFAVDGPRALLVGNCVCAHREMPNFIPGCPPTTVAVMDWIAPAWTRNAFFGPESTAKKA